MAVEDRIDELELRLAKYHECLGEAIQQRDRLALDAAWGVHQAFVTALVVGVIYLSSDRAFGVNSWITGSGLLIVSLVAYFIVFTWTDHLRLKEVDKLAALPEWRWKSS